MWPMLLDYTKDESKRMLRRLELGAYASIISVFRAQGDLSKEKVKILRDLQQTLSISTERHRAEVRRAVNDEKLATIADSMVGNASTTEWMVEGRRLVPLMPRLVPQTAYTAKANQVASAMLEKNNALPPPFQTCNKEGANVIATKPARSTSPSSNVVVLPSGTSIYIKGMLSQDEDEELGMPSHRRNMRSLSAESQNASTVSTQTPRVTYTSAGSTASGTSPVKITISKSPQGRPASVHTGSQPPKVILVTSAGPNPVAPIVQRSMSVPAVRPNTTTMVTASGAGPLRSSVFGPSVPPPGAYSGVVTSTTMTTSISTPVTVASTSSIGSSPAMFSPSVQIGLGKVRPRIVPRQRYPSIPQQKPGVVIPMGPQLMSPSSQGLPSSTGIQTVSSHHHVAPGPHAQVTHHTTAGNLQVKAKPTIQIKQEGGMKIITQSGTSKILPKPSQFSGSGGTPVVMVNAGQSTSGTSSTVTMLPRTISTYTAHSGGKVLNITTPGGRVIATTTKATNVVTVNPKTLHLTAVKSGSGSTTVSKPNVIVVQKTQHPRFQSQISHNTSQVRTVPTTSLPGVIDKELVGLVHKEAGARHIVSGPSTQIGGSIGRPGERRVIITTSGGSGETTKPVSIIHRNRSDSEGKTSCLLTELIHAARILPSDSATETTGVLTNMSAYEPEGIVSVRKTVAPATAPSVSSLPLSSSIPMSNPVIINQNQNLASSHHLTPKLTGSPAVDEEDEDDVTATMQDIGRSAEPLRIKSENGQKEGEQIFSLEQAMSLINQEAIDLTESDPKPVTAAIPSNSSQPPTTSPSVMPPSVMQLPGLPKVSILSTAQKGGAKLLTSANVEVLKERDSFSSTVIKDDNVKEGVLDTQTGLFYPTSASSNVNATVVVTGLSHLNDDESSAGKVSSSVGTQVIAAKPLPSAEISGTPDPQALETIAPTPQSLLSSSLAPRQQPALDLLSSSLAQAGLNLDSLYQDSQESDYGEGDLSLAMEDGEEEEEEEEVDHVDLVEPSLNSSAGSSSNRQGMAEVIREETAKDGTRILTVSNPASSQQDVTGQTNTTTQQLVSLPSQLTRPLSTALIVSSAPCPSSSTISPTAAPYLAVPELSKTSTTKTLPVPASLSQSVQLDQNVVGVDSNSFSANFLPVAVNVEPSAAVITLKLDELTSRVALEDQLTLPEHDVPCVIEGAPSKITIHVESQPDPVMIDGESIGLLAASNDSGVTASNSSDSQGEGAPPSDLSALVRSSKRKRKHPSDSDSSPVAPASWVKSASSLLMKVCQFKGSPRDRSEMPAAQWFLFPVNQHDAPGYYQVVTNPMDFSTMRKKLKDGQYGCFEDFKSDMELIQSNCYLYNREGTQVRKDCDEVMSFYRSELSKINEKPVVKDIPVVNASPLKRTRVDEKSIP